MRIDKTGLSLVWDSEAGSLGDRKGQNTPSGTFYKLIGEQESFGCYCEFHWNKRGYMVLD